MDLDVTFFRNSVVLLVSSTFLLFSTESVSFTEYVLLDERTKRKNETDSVQRKKKKGKKKRRKRKRKERKKENKRKERKKERRKNKELEYLNRSYSFYFLFPLFFSFSPHYLVYFYIFCLSLPLYYESS